MENIFYGTRGTRTAKILIVGESWGKTEARLKKPFVGESGQDLDRLLTEAKIPANDCLFSNVVPARPDNNEMHHFFYRTSEARSHKHYELRGLYPQPIILDGLEKLKTLIKTVRPKLIIGFGNYALWALTYDCFTVGDGTGSSAGFKVPQGISDWRGSQLYTTPEFGNVPFLPTYHPAAALRTYPWRYMIQHDLRVRVKKAFNGEWDEPKYDFTIRPQFEQVTTFLLHILSELSREKTRVSLDLETRSELIACVGLSLDDRQALCVPFMCVERDTGYWGVEEEYEIVQLLRKILTHENLLLVGQNLLYDLQYIVDQLFCRPIVFFDTMIGQHTLWPGGGDPKSAKSFSQGIQRKGLGHLSSLYCFHHKYWKDEGKTWEASFSEDQLWNYNCKDTVKTYEVCEQEETLIDRFNLREQFDFQMRVANDMALEMMINGIKVNKNAKKKVTEELQVALNSFDASLTELIPPDIRKAVEPKTWKKDKVTGRKFKTPWFTSPKQQGQIFYDFLGVKPILHKQTKKPTLNKEALPILAQREPIIEPIVDKLEIRRSLGVYHSTFAESEEEPDGRARCSYNVTGTDTYRFSSSENIYGRGGNFQNIPSGREDDSGFEFPNMRKHFEPSAGYEIAEFDLSGADAQVVAWEANDLDLMDAFRQGMKIHLKNSRDLFPDETRDMTDEEIKAGSGIPGSIYDSIKKGVHATNYGGTPPTLASRLRWKISKAEEFQERWFYLHPPIPKWHERTDRHLNGLQCWKCNSYTNGKHICPNCSSVTGRTVGNKFGYRIVYFDRINDLRNKALAWVPQSTVAINANKGAIALRDHCPWVRLLLQVHDSIVVEYPYKYSDRLPEIKSALHSVSIPYSPSALTIPWEPKVSRISWGDCKKIEW